MSKMKTIYKFAVYEAPAKYCTFTVVGEKEHDMMRNKLRKHGYWFVINYTT